MCGLTGIFVLDSPQPRLTEDLLRHMSVCLRHRGPDDSGTWIDPDAAVGFGHRRLAIIDLSPHGHQPMVSAAGRYVLAFNGEIYNFEDLRSELHGLGHVFTGHSDTEVMLAAFSEWGVERGVMRLNGMFAFSLWDHELGRLTLGRDRLGEKPLYYAFSRGHLVFGSELASVTAHPAVSHTIDRSALTDMLGLGYVPAPRSILEGVRKLPPGTLLHVDRAIGDRAQPVPYWSLAEVVGQPRSEAGEAAQVEELHHLLRDAVRIRMAADVPLGSFLSGGVDSSLVTALMQDVSAAPVKTYSIGFQDTEFDEAVHARGIAAHLGTNHTEFTVTADDVLKLVDRVPLVYDEPFADPSQLPTMLVCALAREHVTVALTGDGGDELFGGYRRYAYSLRTWDWLRRLPYGGRRLAGRALAAPSVQAWGRLERAGSGVGIRVPERLASRVQKAAASMGALDHDHFYSRLMSQWTSPATLVVGAQEQRGKIREVADAFSGLERLERMMAVDTATYLPDDILVKVDRASMAVSLETRVPLLDHRLVEAAWRMPATTRVRRGEPKWPLKQVLDRYVPRELMDRPKQGFDVPLATWLRGPLREWATDLLSPARMKRDGLLDPGPITNALRAHLSGERDLHQPLWNVLMCQSWLDAAREPARALSA